MDGRLRCSFRRRPRREIKSEFGQMLDSEESKQFTEGEVFKVKISIGQDYVPVDIGYKQEGLVSVKEFLNFDGSQKWKKDKRLRLILRN